MLKRFINKDEATQVIQYLTDDGFDSVYDKKRNKLTFEADEEKVHLRLSVELAYQEGYLIDLTSPYLMVLIQSGSASIGVYQEGECLKHKVFGAYMVRKKQGKSQVKHLKTKGKSRAGSRLRLAGALEFFEEINQRLDEHVAQYEIGRIALSCSKILQPLFYSSNTKPPFHKGDSRLVNVPFDVNQPNFTEMIRIQKLMMKNDLQLEEGLLSKELQSNMTFL